MANRTVDGQDYEVLDFTGPRASFSLLGERQTVADSQDAYCIGSRAVNATRAKPAAGDCRCGCGRQTPIATCNDPVNGKRKGKPLPYCKGHEPKGWKLVNR